MAVLRTLSIMPLLAPISMECSIISIFINMSIEPNSQTKNGMDPAYNFLDIG
jgi:hypothetical protein